MTSCAQLAISDNIKSNEVHIIIKARKEDYPGYVRWLTTRQSKVQRSQFHSPTHQSTIEQFFRGRGFYTFVLKNYLHSNENTKKLLSRAVKRMPKKQVVK